MRDWKYYLARSWRNTLYVLAAFAVGASLAVIVWLVVTDETFRLFTAVFLGVIIFAALIQALVKLTHWADKVLERDKK
jgi:uncharacterized membrane protein YoaK (UPF0700 family)